MHKMEESETEMKKIISTKGVVPRIQRIKALVFVCFLLVFVISSLASCGSGGSEATGAEKTSEYLKATYPAANMENYRDMEGIESFFVDVTVKDVQELMQKKETFVLFASFETCPWCNLLISHLNQVAKERGLTIAYLDTRKDSSWSSNIDIDDYDIFIELFGDSLEPDAAGIPHLYVPMLYFIKDGQVVGARNGVHPEIDSPDQVLTDELIAKVKADLESYFDQIK